MEDLVPTEFYLGQNFPDPFKNKTIIKYCLPEEIRIRLEIFDSQKQKIKTLVDEIKEPGTYKIEFCAKGFREGIYLYSLTAGSIIITKRMLILK